MPSGSSQFSSSKHGTCLFELSWIWFSIIMLPSTYNPKEAIYRSA